MPPILPFPPVFEIPTPSIDPDDLADQWAGDGDFMPETGGGLHIVTYSFPDTMPADWADVELQSEIDSFEEFSADAQAMTSHALSLYAEVSDLRFINVTNFGGAFNQGRMEFFAYEMRNNDTDEILDGAAYGRHPNNDATHTREADVRVNTDKSAWDSVQNGGSLRLMLHEIGHTLNFEHPGAYDVGTFPDGQTNAESYAEFAEYIEDSRQYTVMSYFGEGNTGADFNGNRADGLMLHDIKVVQDTYGTNWETRDGNTRYGYNSTEDGMHDWTENTRPIYAIWDGGGIDWIDVSGSGTFAAQIDLREGHFSATHGMTSNLAIAYGARIENAVGTSNGDVIIGNQWNNVLYGGFGTDEIHGRGGNDRIYGEGSQDTITGGSGADTIFGGTSNDDLSGGWGRDVIFGQDGNDEIRGQQGYDLLFGGQGNDTAYGGWGQDTVSGASGADQLYGQGGRDLVSGGSGADTLRGGGSDDTLTGGSGNDDLDGGSGTDLARFLHGGDWTVNLGAGTATMGGETDSLASIEDVLTGAGDDSVSGSSASNVIDTGAGNDTASGGLGDDHFLMGSGDDEVRLLIGDHIVNGGSGFDIVRYNVLGAVDVDLAAGGVQNTSAWTDDVLISIEGVVTSIGADEVHGSNSANFLSTNVGNDTIDGRAGDDVILAGGGDDLVQGGSGDDDIDAGAGSDTVDGGAGDDTVDGGDGNDVLSGGSGNDNLSGGAGRDFIDGGTGDDTLSGGDDTDQLRGSAGDDLLDGGAAGDILDGGNGTDTASYASAPSAVVASLEDPSGNTGDADGDRYARIENLAGSAFDDVLAGDRGANVIYGRAGDDTLIGNGGDDTLIGGSGFDTHTGGDGADVFVFGTNLVLQSRTLLEKGIEVITDFEQGLDLIEIDVSLRTSFRDLEIFQSEKAAFVTLGDLNLQLNGVDAKALTADDFAFV